MTKPIAQDAMAAASWTLLLVLLNHMQENGLLQGVTADQLLAQAKDALASARDGATGEATIRDAMILLSPSR